MNHSKFSLCLRAFASWHLCVEFSPVFRLRGNHPVIARRELAGVGVREDERAAGWIGGDGRPGIRVQQIGGGLNQGGLHRVGLHGELKSTGQRLRHDSRSQSRRFWHGIDDQ